MELGQREPTLGMLEKHAGALKGTVGESSDEKPGERGREAKQAGRSDAKQNTVGQVPAEFLNGLSERFEANHVAQGFGLLVGLAVLATMVIGFIMAAYGMIAM